MKPFLTILFLLCVCSLRAGTFYVSGAGSNSANGTTKLTPWQTVAKVNGTTFTTGDSVLFQGGYTYTGRLTAQSGVKYGSYDTLTGRPILSVLTPVTGWTTAGGNIWSASFGSGAYLNCVTVAGMITPMGRYPNADASNGGYLTYETFSGQSSITDNQLSNSPSWVGAQVVIRKNDWVTDVCWVTAQGSGTITYSNIGNASTVQTLNNNFGYLFQNSLATLDQQNEWYYDRGTSTLYIYSTTSPTSVAASSDQYNVLVDGVSNSSFCGIRFQGGDTAIFNIVNSSTNTKIKKCELYNAGTNGVLSYGCTYTTVDSCYIHDINNSGIKMGNWQGAYSHNNTFTYNCIRRCGLYPGMGSQNNQERDGIFVEGDNNVIYYNTIDSIGYCGVTVNGSYVYVRYNFISHWNVTVKDGGGIYTNGAGVFGNIKTNIYFCQNVITVGYGHTEGTGFVVPGDDASPGIYADEASANETMDSNSISFATQAGIYIHNSYNIKIRDNIIYKSDLGILLKAQGGINYPITGMNIKRNQLYSNDPAKHLLYITTDGDSLHSIGVIDSNYYHRPFADGGVVYYETSGGIKTAFDVSGVYSGYGMEQHGYFGKKIPIYLTSSSISANRAGTSSLTLTSTSDFNRIDMGGAVTAGHKYLLRFDMAGQTNSRNVHVYVQENGGSYPILENRYFPVKTTTTSYEYLIVPNGNYTNPFIAFDVAGLSLPLTISNATLYEVNTTATNLDTIYSFASNYTSGSVKRSVAGQYRYASYDAPAKPVVNADGLHADNPSVFGSFYFVTPGLYPISVQYFENTGGQGLGIYWTGPGITRQAIPNSALYYNNINQSANGLAYRYYEGLYSTMPDFNSLTALKDGVTSNFDISIRPPGVNDAFAFTWEGYISIPRAGTYTFEVASDDGCKLFIGDVNSTYLGSVTLPPYGNTMLIKTKDYNKATAKGAFITK